MKTSFSITALLFTLVSSPIQGEELTVLRDISYATGAQTGAYARERLVLDLYLPAEENKDFPVIVWFHGGGIQNGDKARDKSVAFARRFAGEGIAVVSANYRLSPKVEFPTYIEDCAASVNWTLKNISGFGGDPKKLFVSGHSAGGYLAAMLGMDPQYLARFDIAPTGVAGFIPVAGQMITHSTVRKERGIGKYQPVIDEGAPSFFARRDAPPFLCLVGDDDMAARLEENRLFAAFMKAQGNEEVELFIGDNRDHSTIAAELASPGDPGAKAILDFIARHSR